jgi:hypothetical protein
METAETFVASMLFKAGKFDATVPFRRGWIDGTVLEHTSKGIGIDHLAKLQRERCMESIAYREALLLSDDLQVT